MRTRPVPTSLAAVLLTAMAAASLIGRPAAAATPSAHYWYGTVTKIVDGDSIYVDIAGDGLASVAVRIAGIQATEMYGGVGGGPECHAAEATAAMTGLVPLGSRVRLAAYHPSSTSGKDFKGAPRYIRYVNKYNPSTRHYDIDVQLALLKAGQVLWKPEPVESFRNAAYHLPMQQAMAARIGIFDLHHCGAGPHVGLRLPMWIHYDADGVDTANNGEWLRIRNLMTYDLPLAGWRLRDATHSFNRGTTYYVFPAGAVVPAGKTITVYPGSGTTSVVAGRYYLGTGSGPHFVNVSDPRLGYPGHSVFLVDPDLDFRGWADYPCLTGCARPPVHIANVRYRTSDEYVDLRLDTTAVTPVDLSGVEVTNDGLTKEIAPGTRLNPGETLRVYCERSGRDSRLVQYWGHSGGGTMLQNSGDTVVLRTARSTVLDTYRWGTG